MLGGIIGDLAATTWQRDHNIFYKKLIEPDTRLTQWGAVAYHMFEPIVRHREITPELLHEYLFKPLFYETKLSDGMSDWVRTGFGRQVGSVKFGVATILMAMTGWANDNVDEAIKQAQSIATHLYLGKEGYYAAMTIAPLIVRLRQGATKKETFESLNDLGLMIQKWPKAQRGPLGVLARAWDAFYRSFDFTSAIHSAVKSPVDPNLTAIVTGLIAEAMYGSEQALLKRKYSDNPYFYIELPKDIDVKDIRQYKERVRKFFPKNRALTNVERHKWTTVPDIYSHIFFDQKLLEKIRMSFDTGWEDRFGIYLDDGWYYVYRSHYLMARFTIVEHEQGYRIGDLQISDEKTEMALIAVENALYATQCPPYKLDMREPVLLSGLLFMRYYKGEAKCPYSDDVRYRMWHGERAFIESRQWFYRWLLKARDVRANQEGEALQLIKHLSNEELAIRLYIEEMIRKWRPMESDITWIYKN